MKNSISKRISTITFGLISTVFLLIFSFQILFFEEFYLSKKTENLILDVKRFQAMYSYQIMTKESLTNALINYEEKNNSRIAIFSLDGELKYLSLDGQDFEDTKSLTDFCAELLSNEALIKEVLSNDKIETTIFTNRYSSYKKIGVISPMSLQSKNDSILISVSSVQPIKEASDVIKTFSFYLFIGLLIVAMFLSKIYSKLISKPLVNLNRVAKKMSLLDFNAKCDVNSDDEIGNLAKTLNFLSSNLEKSLHNLKEKNEQLERDIEKERNLEKMRKDFVSSVSHDLKTPIGIISGYAEGLKDGIVTGDDAKVYLETIIDESTKMNLLLTNMLELSRLECDTIHLNLESFNIVRMLRGLSKKFSLEFQNKNLNLVFDMPKYAYVEGDILTLERVIQNLLSNTIKYTPSGNYIYISIHDNNDKYNISIENKGVTIPENELENIFAKFYRLDKSGDRTKNSFGLGLATVKRILELHNSEFSIKNSDNGVVFTFSLKKQDIIIDNLK